MRLLTLSICSLVLFSTLSQAKNPDNKLQAPYQKGSTVGISYEFNGQELYVLIDPKEVLKTIPKLQKTGLIDRNLTKTEIGFYQSLLAGTASIPYVTNLIKTIYSKNNQINQISVYTYLLSPDLYGNTGKEPCYSFDFDRNLYQRINWANFQSNNIKRITSNFKTSDQCDNLTDLYPPSF